MSNSRERILQAIRDSLGKAILPEAKPEHPSHVLPRAVGGVEEFISEVERLSGQVIRATSVEEALREITALLSTHSCDQVMAWDWAETAFPEIGPLLAEHAINIVSASMSPQQLSHIEIGVTGAEAGLADTGTIVVRNGVGRSSVASLLPPVHIAILKQQDIFPDMQSYLDNLESQANGARKHVASTSNLVFISGPSRTGDIEQTLTLGVHGPRELIIILVP